MRILIMIFLILLPVLGYSQNIKSDSIMTNVQSNDVVKFYDKQGNAYLYSKKDYGEKILPEELKLVWDKPDGLYSLIGSALGNGFSNELIDAGQRLISIDSDTSRAYNTMGVIYLKCNLLDKAEQILLYGINKCSDKAYLKTNLAKVYQTKGFSDKSYNTLWEAIELDPNQDNAVIWIGAINREKGGREEYLKIMRKIAEIPSSWRAQLWIARDYLDNNDSVNALQIYKEILPKVKNEPDAMWMISGDLGKHGKCDEIISMVYPLYDLNKLDYRTGINIISACIESKNKVLGFKILDDIKKLNRYDLTSLLIRLENGLNKIQE